MSNASIVNNSSAYEYSVVYNAGTSAMTATKKVQYVDVRVEGVWPSAFLVQNSGTGKMSSIFGEGDVLSIFAKAPSPRI